jgi:LacI family transcriptional regulator
MTKKSKHPTLSEVAKKAGVGTTTVSRVINGGQRVDSRTLARVRRVIEDLGYLPNEAARILKGGRARTIGFVVPSIADPFFSSCAEAAQVIARANDSLLIVITTQNDPQAEVDGVNVLMRHRADGFIIASANSESKVLRNLLHRLSVPIVAMDRLIADSTIPSVVADNFAGAQNATQHLIEHGYKRIVCLTGETNLYTIHERIRGYRKAMRSSSLNCILDASIKDYQSAHRVIEKMLGAANPPNAFFTLKNSTTIHTFEVLQKLGVPIPARVALLGYDDFALAGTVRPSISVVQQPIEEIGRVATELLFERLLNPHASGGTASSTIPHHIQLKTRLIPRSSCGCSPSAA